MRVDTLAISYTDKCNAACRHCCVCSGPKKNNKLDASLVISRLKQFSENGFKKILFTGGEPSLFIDEIAKIVKNSRKYGYRSGIFTNGSWAVTEKSAEVFSKKLSSMGMSSAVLSTSRYHREYVPFNTIMNAAKALKKQGLNVIVSSLYSNRSDPGEVYVDWKLANERIDTKQLLLCPDGRGSSLPETAGNFTIKAEDAVHKGSCDLMGQLYISHDGGIRLCCSIDAMPNRVRNNYFYYYGDIRKMPTSEIVKRIADCGAVAKLMSLRGPGGFYKLKKKQFDRLGFRLKKGYASICELCRDLFGDKRFEEVVRQICRDIAAKRTGENILSESKSTKRRTVEE